MGLKLYKQWLLKPFSQQDVEYVHGCGCGFEIEDDSAREISVSGGQTFWYQGGPRNLYIVTDNVEHESMIQLKFSGRMQLLRTWYADEWLRYEF